MRYKFTCPSCGNKQEVEMKITEYVAEGHKCDKCGGELVREVSDMVCGASVDKTGGFYRKVN